MAATKTLLIINPHSGTRDKSRVPLWLSEAVKQRGGTLDVAETHAPGEAAPLALKGVAEGYRAVVAAGGDGTVREVATALCGTPAALGIIPCGSGNGLARSLGISQDFRKAVDTAAEMATVRIDRGCVNGLPFYCTFGMGFDAAVSEKFAREKRRGRMSYVKSALSEFLSFRPQAYAISVGGEVITHNAMVIAVCNAPQYGNNAYIAPSASLSDGLLDITVIHDGSILYQALAGFELLSGRLDRNILVDTFRISSASIARLSDAPAQLDGEPVEMPRVLEVECQPGRLEVIAPASPPEFRPIVTPLKSMFDDLLTDVRHILKV